MHVLVVPVLLVLFGSSISKNIPFRHLQRTSDTTHLYEDRSEKSSSGGASNLLPFLKKFGYLDKGNGSANANQESADSLYTLESMQQAIREMQKFGGLPQSGELNKETLQLLSKPRCGLPDVFRTDISEKRRRKRFVIGSKGWNKRRITYRVENWPSQFSESSVVADIKHAFSTWANYARLRFVDKSSRDLDDVDIAISFGRGYHGDSYSFDGNGGVLAHAFFPYGHGALAGDIHFDLDENWRSSASNDDVEDPYLRSPISFLAVAVHEIGHSLGLSHSPSLDSVMFPYYQSFDKDDPKNIRLGHDDIMAMYQLYIEREIQDIPDEAEVPVTLKPTTGYTTRRSTTSTGGYDSVTITSTSTEVLTKTTEASSDPSVPQICKDGFDTISYIRREIFVFKDDYMWRFTTRGLVEPIYPVKTSRLFSMLSDVSKIDAAFETEDGKILFVAGKRYWEYDGSKNAGPLPISDLGLPSDLEHIDAAFVWGKNKKIYFFSGHLFWRYNALTGKMDEGYPKGMDRWKGLPRSGISSAFTWLDGRTYFFKENEFWRFDDDGVRTEDGFPHVTSNTWFGC